MYVQETKPPFAKEPIILLRESYREDGKVKKRNVGNISHLPKEEIEAIKLALKHKGNLAELVSVKEDLKLKQDRSVGAVATVYQVAQRLHIVKALGAGTQGKLALWQVIARVIEQGSRLSAVRLANAHAACEILSITEDFNEDKLYENLRWLCENQQAIEDSLFKLRRGDNPPTLFLYDVTSSYLEGHCNALAWWGYNRDGKKGKMQIVIGLLCDESGEPVSTEVFAGNTQDTCTFASQVKKASERFGCERVTFVGDRGMIKSGQIEALKKEGFHYITAITKPQIESMLAAGVFQMSLFDSKVCEVEKDGVRYVLRRNPLRAEEIAWSRRDKRRSVEALLKKKNVYLAEHPKAQVDVAKREVAEKIKRLKIGEWLSVASDGRTLRLAEDEAAYLEAGRLDGCYVIKTDLPVAVASAQVAHDRYKDLAMVEQAFKVCKTEHLEMRPLHLRSEASTRGFAVVVMLAYLIRRELSRCWRDFDLMVAEGISELTQLCVHTVFICGKKMFNSVPEPRESSLELLKSAGIKLPEVLPLRKAHVDTRKKLPERRK